MLGLGEGAVRSLSCLGKPLGGRAFWDLACRMVSGAHDG